MMFPGASPCSTILGLSTSPNPATVLRVQAQSGTMALQQVVAQDTSLGAEFALGELMQWKQKRIHSFRVVYWLV